MTGTVKHGGNLVLIDRIMDKTIYLNILKDNLKQIPLRLRTRCQRAAVEHTKETKNHLCIFILIYEEVVSRGCCERLFIRDTSE